MQLQNCLLSLFVLASVSLVSCLRDGECEVCVKFLKNFRDNLVEGSSEEERKDTKHIEDRFKDHCSDTKNRHENRFCYYIGGLEESATGILNEVSRPMTYDLPAEKICEKLKRKDAQVCDLKYDVQIDLDNVDFKKLRVKQLSKIIDDLGGNCLGCIEKNEFIAKIQELRGAAASSTSRNEL